MRTLDPELADRVKAEGECLVWTCLRTLGGYGMKTKDRLISYTHRVSWAYANDTEIPKGMFILHKCDNPPCLLPDHLWLGTQEDNMIDMVEKGRWGGGRKNQEFCKRGHNMTEASYIRKDTGKRQCRPCDVIRSQEYKARKKAKQ